MAMRLLSGAALIAGALGHGAMTFPKPRNALDGALDAVDRVAQRYDWLSAGLGALAGTSYGVYRGQPVGQALGITLCATVVALAVDEAIKDQEARRDESE